MTSGSYNRTKLHNKRIGLANKGKKRSEAFKRHLSSLYKGKSLIDRFGVVKANEIKQKQVHIGRKNGMFGKKRPDLALYNKIHPKCGRDNPSWNNGSSFIPYTSEFSKRLKKEIKTRDKFTCQICNNESAIIQIHHIDYDKNNCSKNNLISLCPSCHGQTQHNRQYYKWQLQLFMNIWHDTNYNIYFKEIKDDK